MSTGEQKEQSSEAQTETQTTSALDQAISATKQTKPDRARELISTLVEEVNRGTVSIDKDVVRTITAGIAEIDKVISKQLAAIMHAPAFQKLEGTWRGHTFLATTVRSYDRENRSEAPGQAPIRNPQIFWPTMPPDITIRTSGAGLSL